MERFISQVNIAEPTSVGKLRSLQGEELETAIEVNPLQVCDLDD